MHVITGTPPSQERHRRAAFLAVIMACACVCGWGAAVAAELPFREWTDRDEHRIRARLVGMDAERAVVRLRLLFDGTVIELPVANLTEADQRYVEAHRDAFAAPGEPLPEGGWPREVLSPDGFEVEESRPDAATHLYRTPHFEFRSDVKLAPSLIRHYARVFEGTHQVLGRLPLRLDGGEDPPRHAVRFFRRHDEFIAAGGIAGSGGVYLAASREILVPLSSVGVRVIGDQVAFHPETFDAAPLVHEITHQLMHPWLDIFPVWFCEGLAEYLAAVPFEGGNRFDFTQIHEGIRRHLARRPGEAVSEGGWITVDLMHPEDLVRIGHRRWADAVADGTQAGTHYRSALLLLYYLVHLEGEGDASALIRYFHETRGSELHRRRYVRDYNDAVERYRRQLSEWAEAYNRQLILHRMETLAYNQKVETFNRQVRAGFAESERIDPGPRPGPPPQPPPKPEPPGVLAGNPDGQVPVDVAAAEAAARDRLWGGKRGEALWQALEEAFAARRIRIRQVWSPGPAAE
jgi:hypothetical protein